DGKTDPVEAMHAGRVETIKAALLSGATKQPFAGLAQPWHRTNNGSFVEPLDRRFGAGQLNINNSHLILSAPEQNGADQLPDARPGWDYEPPTAVGQTRHYYSDVPAGVTGAKVTATLDWLRHVTQAGSTFTATLSRLELRLFKTDANLNLGSLLDSSVSPIDNVQHLYDDVSPGGHYALEVLLANLPTGQLSEDYGVAWQTTFAPVPEPGGWALAGLVMVGFAVARRARSASRGPAGDCSRFLVAGRRATPAERDRPIGQLSGSPLSAPGPSAVE